jgi:Glycosyl transferases group 1
MKILFMIDRRANAGSIQAVASYVRAGDELGHTIAVHGHSDPKYPGIRWSTEFDSFDHVVFICEFGIGWMSALRMSRVLTQVPRKKRAILDADGMYNPVLSVDMYDRNHADEHARARWVGHCDSLADKIFQPTLEPLHAAVLPLPFYGYDPALRLELGARPKSFDIVHLGHNWWRWREVSSHLLPAIERIRPKLDGICFVGLWWDMVPAGAREQNLETAFEFDIDRFRRLGIQVKPAVPFTEVVSAMSEGRVNIMTQRPLFRRLKLLTAKYFEIFCADTIPLVMLEPAHSESIYGPTGRELALHGNIADKLLDVVQNPLRYRQIVQAVRSHLVSYHSYQKRMQQLVEALRA